MRNSRVLIVDDSKMIRAVTGKRLSAHGMLVETAVDGHDGCRKTFDFSPDVILMDLIMPVMDGVTAIKFLKSNQQTQQIPIIVFTNETDRDDKLKALEVGANDVISKDADEAELVIRVRNLALLKTLEDEVVGQRDKLANILNDLAQAVVILDNQERVVLANGTARSMLNIPTELVGTLDVRELIATSGEVTGFVDKLRDPDVEEIEVSLNTTAGRKLFQVHFSDVFMAEDNPFGKALMFWDVTQEREMEELKSSFHSMIAHDLRSPITVIVGYTDLLINGNAGSVSDIQREFLVAIEDRAQALRKLVDEFLTVSKIENASITLDRSETNINSLLRDVVKSLELIAGNKGIDVVMRLNDSLPELSVDADKLQKVFSNLYDNALKYTPDGGHVDIETSRDGDSLVVKVSDDGIGIDNEELPYVFDRYKRMATAQNRKIKGTGLGLSIVKEIVAAHGGRVWVESAADRGSVFFVSLPIEQNAKVEPVPAETH